MSVWQRNKGLCSVNKAERKHIAMIKNMPCIVCSESAPSDAHHITNCGRRISHYATVPLCKDCHQDNQNGIHGNKNMWRVMKMDEMDALAKTVERLVNAQ